MLINLSLRGSFFIILCYLYILLCSYVLAMPLKTDSVIMLTCIPSFYYYAYPTTAPYYLQMPPTTCYCFLLLAIASYYLLLLPTTCYYPALPCIAFYYLTSSMLINLSLRGSFFIILYYLYILLCSYVLAMPLKTDSVIMLICIPSSYYYACPATASYRLLLLPTTCHCSLLLAIASYCLPMLAIASFRLSLLSTTYQCLLLLPTTCYCFLLLPTTY
jgi:hypothetical protein